MASANGIIVRDPNILGGTPVFSGTRVPFHALLDYLEGGQTLDEFLDDFPTVTKNAAAGGTVTSIPSAISCGTGCTSASSTFASRPSS